MHAITLDPSLCVQCGACAAVCTQAIFRQAPSGEYAVDPAAVERCNGCGHCAAHCPVSAITFDGPASLELPQVPPLAMDDNLRCALFQGRRSTRAYTDAVVPRELSLRALEYARYAPTAGNSQQVEWILLEGRPRLKTMADTVAAWLAGQPGKYAAVAARYAQGHDTIMRGAPCLLLAHADAASRWKDHDASCAATYLELAMHSLGLGTCWPGFVISAARNGADLGLDLPQGREICAGLLFGYPAYSPVRLPVRAPVRVRFQC